MQGGEKPKVEPSLRLSFCFFFVHLLSSFVSFSFEGFGWSLSSFGEIGQGSGGCHGIASTPP